MITPEYYRDAIGAILVFDVTSYSSFVSLPVWLTQLRDFADPNLALMLVANKCDLAEERVVTLDEDARFAQRHGMLFLETSAMDVHGTVKDIFTRLIAEVARVPSKKEWEHADNRPPSTHGMTRSQSDTRDSIPPRRWSDGPRQVEGQMQVGRRWTEVRPADV